MKALISFQNSTTDYALLGEAKRDGSALTLEFTLKDPKGLLQLPKSFNADTSKTPRIDGLWNDTCFEIFLRPTGQPAYYEFNFSPAQAWQQYAFTDYRAPQPPKPSSEFDLTAFTWDEHKLSIRLTGLKENLNYEVSLTAVLKEKSGTIHYMATKHAGPEADFHHRDSFMPLPSANRE